MKYILFLSIILTNLYSMGVEFVRDSEIVKDSITLGITGEIGETIPIFIAERTYNNGLNFKEEVRNHSVALTKRLNEIQIKRSYENNRYTIIITSKDLGITYSYVVMSRFIGMPSLAPMESEKGIKVFQIDGHYYLNDQLYPRIFLKWGNG